MADPISMLVPAALVGILAAPLALKLVPPNRVYGFRTAHTLANRKVWFRVNRVAGFALMAASGLAITVYLSRPELASGRSVLGVLVLILPVLAALLGAGRYARKATAGGTDG